MLFWPPIGNIPITIYFVIDGKILNKYKELMFKSYISVWYGFQLMLQKTILCTCFIFLLIFSFISTSESASTTAQLTTPEVWTAGTRLLIPDRVMENYEKESDSWSHPSVYLFANYFFTGPSLKDKRKETVYIPLVKEQAGEGEQKEVMMDIMNVRRSKDNDSVFITTNNLHVIVIKINEKDLYVGARVDN